MRVIHGRAQIVVTLILEQHHITRLRVTKDRAHLSAIHPVVTVKNARFGRYDKTCHNTATIQ